jgi:hypothetical protein
VVAFLSSAIPLVAAVVLAAVAAAKVPAAGKA